MATLIRSNKTTVYSSVPGLEQDDPISGPTSFTFTPTGQNTQLIYNEDYRVTSPTSDYARFQREYSNDSFFFGQLGTGYGAASRYAADNANLFREVYGNRSNPMSTSGSGVGGSYQINAFIDWDMPNKQAERGTVSYWNKVYSDLKAPAYTPEEIRANTYREEQYGESDAKRAEFYWQIDNPGKWIGNPNYPETYMQKKQPTIPSYSAPLPDDFGWNQPNENYIKNIMGVSAANMKRYGLNMVTENFNTQERLAPTSVSQGRGLFSGPIYGLNGPVNYSDRLTRQLLEQVRSRWS